MASNPTKQIQDLIIDPDNIIPEAIIKLDLKLKGLMQNVEHKLQTSSLYTGDDREEYINKLTMLARELENAIKGIEGIVATVSPLDVQSRKAFFEQQEMQEFNKMAMQQLEQMTKLNLDLLAE